MISTSQETDASQGAPKAYAHGTESGVLDRFAELLELAVTYHHAGQLEEAEHLYKTILEADATQPNANHNLGVMALDSGQFDNGLSYLKTALEANPSEPQYWVSYVDALIRVDCCDGARDVLKQGIALGLRGDDVDMLENQLNSYDALLPKAITQAKPEKTKTKTHSTLQRAEMLLHRGMLAEAKKLYQKLLKTHCNEPRVLTGLGSIALQSGDTRMGIDFLERSLAIEPEQTTVLSNLGIGFTQLGSFEKAVDCCSRAIELSPGYAEAYVNRGNALKALMRYDEAILSYKQAVSLNPGDADAHFNLGGVYKELKVFPAALASYQQATELNPNDADAHGQCGALLLELKLYQDALHYYNRELTLNPSSLSGLRGRCLVYMALGSFEKAKKDAEQAVALNPLSANAFLNLGAILHKLGRQVEALKANDIAIQLEPAYAQVYSNRGLVLVDMHRFDEAMADYNQSIEIDAECANAYWNKAILSLLTGDYAQGWSLYEWRWKTILKDFRRTFAQPLWLGEFSIKDKTLLISAEQGLGDFIQFCRYVPLVAALGPKVVLEVPKALVSLISTLPGNYMMVEQGSTLPSFDYHCPIMSLPLALGTSLSNIPAKVPYLFVNDKKLQNWQKRLGKPTKPRIGLVWSGSTIHQNDHHRSIAFETIEPLLGLPLDFHVLQKEIRKADMERLATHVEVKSHQDKLTDFSETAALIQAMDLIVSVDTSVAHVAAAMGKPCWILLPYSPDFRWMTNREDSPWYPTVTLFRQPKQNDWATVISQIEEKMKEHFCLHRH